MKKEITILDESLMEEFLSIFSIGLLECINNDIIDPLRAEQWLFSPVIAYSSQLKIYSKQFRRALDFASETDAARKSNLYKESISENLALFYKVLAEVPKNSFDGEMLLDGVINSDR